jgi:hypothetical protein
MTKRPALGAPLRKPEPPRQEVAPRPPPKTDIAPSRRGKVQLAGYFDVEAKRQ